MKKNHTLEALVLAGATAVAAGLVTKDANAEQATGPTHPVLSPELAASIIGDRPLMAVSQEGRNIVIPAGGAWASPDVHESDIVPQAYIEHYQRIRDMLTGAGMHYFLGGLLNQVQMEDGSFAYVPAHSYDFWGLTGAPEGGPAGSAGDTRTAQLDLTDAPAHILADLGLSVGTVLDYRPDHQADTHFYVSELANSFNMIMLTRGHGATDDEIRREARVNMAHAHGGVPGLNQIYVIRRDSNDHDGTINLYIGRGNLIYDVMVRCPDTGVCRGEDGQPIQHLTSSSGSQTIDLPDATRLVHWKIEPCNSPVTVYNPQTGTMAPFSDPLFIVSRAFYGAPSMQTIDEAGHGHDDGGAGVDDGHGDGAVDGGVPPVDGGSDPVDAGGQITIPDDGDGAGDGQGAVPCPPPPPCPECPAQPPVDGAQPPVGDGSDGDGHDQVPPVGDGQVPAPTAYNPTWLAGVRYIGLSSEGMPEFGHGIELLLGHRVGENFYLSGIVGGAYFGQDSWSNTAVGQPNPLDPHALTGYATEDGQLQAGMLRLGVEFAYRTPLEFLQLATSLGVDVMFLSGNNDVSEWLENPAGTVVDSNVYSDNLDQVIPRGFWEIGPDFRLHPNVSLGARYMMQFDGDGITGHGVGVGITGYWGGSSDDDYSGDGNQ